MTGEQRLRIASAEALGYKPWEEPSGLGDIRVVMIRKGGQQPMVWQPDIHGYEAQLVECWQEFIEHCHGSSAAFHSMSIRLAVMESTFQDVDWKLAIMRAVAEVGNDKAS